MSEREIELQEEIDDLRRELRETKSDLDDKEERIKKLEGALEDIKESATTVL